MHICSAPQMLAIMYSKISFMYFSQLYLQWDHFHHRQQATLRTCHLDHFSILRISPHTLVLLLLSIRRPSPRVFPRLSPCRQVSLFIRVPRRLCQRCLRWITFSFRLQIFTETSDIKSLPRRHVVGVSLPNC